MQADFPETIFALATPPGRSGVAVLRLSGPHCDQVLDALGIRPLPAPRQATLRRLRHPISGEPIDQALILRFIAPHSFTGEHALELQTHGSRAVIGELLEALSQLPGVRLAEPGEFARRAFYNRKMDLAETEGLADLIDAETTAQKRQALRQMEGALSQRCQELREAVVRSLAYLEAFLDFPDEDIPAEAMNVIDREIEQALQAVNALLGDQRRGEMIREGFSVAIIGAPNAGKSSLLNALAQRDVAIVTDQAGTTRDVLEVRLDLRGYLVTLADTAGLRQTEDAIEAEGIRRAQAWATQADLRILLFDPTQSPETQRPLLTWLQPHDMLVYSKADQWQGQDKALSNIGLRLSVQDGTGIEDLIEQLFQRMVAHLPPAGDPLITRARHRQAFREAGQRLEAARQQHALELKAEELRLAVRALATVIGVVGVEDILDMVFSSFCLGK